MLLKRILKASLTISIMMCCLSLSSKWLKAGIVEEDGEIQYPEEGTPQGGSISPILANIY
jgi:retron-type reverse transcriptase